MYGLHKTDLGFQDLRMPDDYSRSLLTERREKYWIMIGRSGVPRARTLVVVRTDVTFPVSSTCNQSLAESNKQTRLEARWGHASICRALVEAGADVHVKDAAWQSLLPRESQRVHVGIWYILRAQRGSHIPTLRAKYIPYSYMDPLGMIPELIPHNP